MHVHIDVNDFYTLTKVLTNGVPSALKRAVAETLKLPKAVIMHTVIKFRST